MPPDPAEQPRRPARRKSAPSLENPRPPKLAPFIAKKLARKEQIKSLLGATEPLKIQVRQASEAT